MVKSRDMRWAWHGARVTEMRNACRVLIRKRDEMRPRGSSEEGREFKNEVGVD
jgi:hypothetical protein